MHKRRKKQLLVVGVIIAVLFTFVGPRYHFKEEEEHYGTCEDYDRDGITREDKYKTYRAEILYNKSMNAEELLSALEPLNYSIEISGPYIEIDFSTSLSDINKSCPSLREEELRSGGNYTDNTAFDFHLESEKDNTLVIINFDEITSPFVDFRLSEKIMQKIGTYVKDLILEKTGEMGDVTTNEIYRGPIP